MIKEGSLPHNRYYPIKGPKRRAHYESTVKERIYRSYFFAVQKSYLGNKRSGRTQVISISFGITLGGAGLDHLPDRES
jgi:hypothetical protein